MGCGGTCERNTMLPITRGFGKERTPAESQDSSAHAGRCSLTRAGEPGATVGPHVLRDRIHTKAPGRRRHLQGHRRRLFRRHWRGAILKRGAAIRNRLPCERVHAHMHAHTSTDPWPHTPTAQTQDRTKLVRNLEQLLRNARARAHGRFEIQEKRGVSKNNPKIDARGSHRCGTWSPCTDVGEQWPWRDEPHPVAALAAPPGPEEPSFPEFGGSIEFETL